MPSTTTHKKNAFSSLPVSPDAGKSRSNSLPQKLPTIARKLSGEKVINSLGVQQREERAREMERRRIGLELHDNVNQMLACAKLSIEAIEATGTDMFLRNKALQTLVQVIEEIRKLSMDMTTTPAQKDFLMAVRELAAGVGQTNVFQVRVIDNGGPFEALDANRQTALIRIIQEQLNNAIKHSKASKVTIRLKCRRSDVQLVISDDGIGFNIENIKRGVGLSGISERTRMYNGVAAVRSSIGHGCSLFVRLPFA